MVRRERRNSTINEEKYNRQTRIKGWNQEKLRNSKVVVVGADILGEMVLSCMAGMGVGNIFIFDNKNLSKSPSSYLTRFSNNRDELERIISCLEDINKDINIDGAYSGFSKSFLNYEGFKPDVIVDTTNELTSKEMVLEYSKKNKIPFISSYCNHKKSLLSVYDTNKDNVDELLDSEKILDNDPNQGGITAGINAGIIVDEIRKSLFRLEDLDQNLEERVVYNIDSSIRTSLNSDLPKISSSLEHTYVLVAGAGAIGNWTALNLALAGFKNIDIMDYDEIEDHNRNRQILYFDGVEGVIGKKKARVLSERLSHLEGQLNIKHVVKKIDDSDKTRKYFDTFNYDLVFGCMDGFNSRYDLNEISKGKGIPYVDGGTSKMSGTVHSYVPKKTNCMKCQMSLEKTKEKNSASCINEPSPSVVIPNIITGSLMVGEGIRILSGDVNSRPIGYDSYRSKNRIYLKKQQNFSNQCGCK